MPGAACGGQRWMDIEIDLVNKCHRCPVTRNELVKTDRWFSTNKPWSRIHIDFAGPFHGNLFFILIDLTSCIFRGLN